MLGYSHVVKNCCIIILQEDHRMRMREWTEYYLNPVKKKILNVISLEFSTTRYRK